MTAATQLTLYQDALLLCGERFLLSLTEEREPRRLLDRVWANDPVKACLEMGQWNFAMRTQQLDYDPSVQPTFGYPRAFNKTTDWVLTSAVCSDEFFRSPLTRYVDEAGFLYSDLDTIYVRFVSNDVTYGGDFTLWPETFRDVVSEFMASKIIRKITNSEDEETNSRKRLKDKLMHAKSMALMAGPTMFPARGQWGLARNRQSTNRDGGNISGSLIG